MILIKINEMTVFQVLKAFACVVIVFFGIIELFRYLSIKYKKVKK
jgi:hypothetical protein